MLHEVAVQTNTFVADLLALAIEHERIPSDAATREAATISRYLGAAIQATENYLDKDLKPVTHTYSDGVTFPLVWTRGNARSVKAKAYNTDVPPVLADLPEQPALSGRRDLRGAALTIGDSSYTIDAGAVLVIEAGFLLAADLPDDVVEFILSVFGTHYALRESSNYSSMVFNVDAYPKFLLDPYRTLSYS